MQLDAEKLTAALRDVFSRIDEDQGGTLDKDEMAQVFEDIGMPLKESELSSVMKDIDKDGGGDVDFDEFCMWMMGMHPYAVSLRANLTSSAAGGAALDEIVTNDDLADMQRQKRAQSDSWIAIEPGDIGRTVFILLEEPNSSKLAKIISLYIQALIFVSTFIFLAETIPSVKFDETMEGAALRDVMHSMEWFCIGHFTVEYVTRVGTCSRRPADDTSVMSYVKQPLNLVDVCAVLPAYIEAFLGTAGGSFAVLRILRLARIFRIIKMGNARENLAIVAEGVNESRGGLMLMIYLVCIFMVVMSSVMYMIEGGSDCEVDASYTGNKSVTDQRIVCQDRTRAFTGPVGCRQDGLCTYTARAFEHIPITFWFTIVTMTSVGYGDMYPVTYTGRFFASFIMLSGILTLAVPITLIGNKFQHVWTKEKQRKHKVKMMLAMSENNRSQQEDENSDADGAVSDMVINTRLRTSVLMLQHSWRKTKDPRFKTAVDVLKAVAIEAPGGALPLGTESGMTPFAIDASKRLFFLPDAALGGQGQAEGDV